LYRAVPKEKKLLHENPEHLIFFTNDIGYAIESMDFVYDITDCEQLRLFEIKVKGPIFIEHPEQYDYDLDFIREEFWELDGLELFTKRKNVLEVVRELDPCDW